MTYHYTMSGLDYVFLLSGFRLRKTEYGDGVSIEKADSLDRSIAYLVVTSPVRLRGQEARFLRAQLDFSQTTMANELGVKRITVARWENAPKTPIPGPADRVIRMIAAKNLLGGRALSAVVDLFPEISDGQPTELHMIYAPDENDMPLFDKKPKSTDGWQRQAATG